MEEGTLAKWLVKEGDAVSSGDIIAEIETDKATMEIEAVEEGTFAKILVPEGTEGVAVNAPIGIILEDGEDVSALDSFKAGEVSPPPQPSPSGGEGVIEQRPGASTSPLRGEVDAPKSHLGASGGGNGAKNRDGQRIFASPLAKRIATENGIDLAATTGSGPGGRIVKRDVESAKAKAPAAKSSPGAAPAIDARAFYDPKDYEEIPLDGMRKTIARRLTQSTQEIPHFYLTIDCEIDELLKVRKRLNEQAPEGVKLSVNDFIIRAAALALVKVPDANVSFAGDALLRHKHADIGVAVALDGGLITPIVKRAETKGLAEISAETKDLAERARTRKLKPTDYEGGSFSISNLGMFGVKNFTAVINPPQAAIMAVGAGEPRAIVRDGELAPATIMTVTLSCDHRAIDGALGAKLLAAFKELIEYPPAMLL